ncbi:MAG: Obg family GTPase CgtA [Thermoleophilia bacterium]
MVERLVARTDFENEEAVAWLQEQLERLGVREALRKTGALDGEDMETGGIGIRAVVSRRLHQ